MKRRPIGLVLNGAGMGAADAVPGVSGGTIAFITGIYEELINTIKHFGPTAFGAWRRGGWVGLSRHLNLAFLIPLLLGVAVSLVSVAHLALWLMEAQPLLLEGFFFGLVAASALVVGQAGERWKIWYLLPLLIGLMLAEWLPSLMPLVLMVGNESLVVILAGSIAISAMLLPGVSGSFLLLTDGALRHHHGGYSQLRSWHYHAVWSGVHHRVGALFTTAFVAIAALPWRDTTAIVGLYCWLATGSLALA